MVQEHLLGNGKLTLSKVIPLQDPLAQQVQLRAALLNERVNSLLADLLAPGNRSRLERFRFTGSTNRVYKIPLDQDWREFIIVKLLPGRWTDFKAHVRRALRNLMYGEHDIVTGRKRARMELDRIKEWQAAGLPVPPSIQVRVPDVRVFYGLPYPTFYTILASRETSIERKLEVLSVVTRALADQHELAVVRQCKSLVHRDPGPWNLMVDPDRDQVYWFDLEHPRDYPRMDLDSLLVRALRVFLFGVLYQLGDHFDQVILTIEANYRLKPVLRELINNIEQSRGTPVGRFVKALRSRNRQYHLRRRIGPTLRAALERAEVRPLLQTG